MVDQTLTQEAYNLSESDKKAVRFRCVHTDYNREMECPGNDPGEDDCGGMGDGEIWFGSDGYR